ncbi:MAG: hypothetical protein AB4426_05010 [Xenococcaceae cyanobacterium]
MQSNKIDELNPSCWLMDKREQVNYKELEFHDPLCIEIMQVIDDYVNKKRLHELLKLYFDDENYIYCFQADHAGLALPIKRASLTHTELVKSGINIKLPDAKKDLLTDMMQKVDASKYLVGKLCF